MSEDDDLSGLSERLCDELERNGFPSTTVKIHFTNNDVPEYIAWFQEVEKYSREHPSHSNIVYTF